MALITCPECEKQISSEATACPHCGYKAPTTIAEQTTKKSMGCGSLILVIIGAIIIFVIIIAALPSRQYTTSEPIKEKTPEENIKYLQDERDSLAEKCKNGYASACEDELAISKLLSAAGAYNP